MNVTYNGNTFACATAYKGPDYARLVDSTGFVVATFHGIKDFSLFTLADGEWTDIPDADNCNLASMAPDGTIMSSNIKVCDVLAPTLVTFTLFREHASSYSYANWVWNINVSTYYIPDGVMFIPLAIGSLESLGSNEEMQILNNIKMYLREASSGGSIVYDRRMEIYCFCDIPKFSGNSPSSYISLTALMFKQPSETTIASKKPG